MDTEVEIVCEGIDISRSAAIICLHVANEGFPILSATRDEPLRAADSGWQFTCGVHDHESADGRVWAVKEIVKLDETIRTIIDSPQRSSFGRKFAKSEWSERPYIKTV